MGYGIDAGIGRTTRYTVQTAEKHDENGVITEMTTFGGMKEMEEETFSTSFTNAATNSQTITSVADGVSEHTLIEDAKGYARETKKTISPLA